MLLPSWSHLTSNILVQCAFALAVGWTPASQAAEAVLGPVPLDSNRNIALGRPLPVIQAQAHEILISRQSYVLSWNPQRRVPNWAAWELRQEDIAGINDRRNFLRDPDLTDYLRDSAYRAVSPSEFTNTCFDRGHQVPSADRTTTSPDGASTYYMSNILPQTAWLNRIEWRNLEYFERKVVKEQGRHLVVFSGGIFSENAPAIGPRHDIAVPEYNFKIIVALAAGETMADVSSSSPMMVLKFPNVNSDGSEPMTHMERTCEDHAARWDRPPETWPASNSWQEYQTTIEEIETLTGYDFFPTIRFTDGFKAWTLAGL